MSMCAMRPGQRFAGLAQQVDRCGPQDQESTLALAAAPAPVDDAAQGLEQLRHPVDLVQDDEPILQVVEEQRGLGEPVAIVAVLQIEVERIARSCDLQCECRLADLPRPDQGHGDLAVQGAFDVWRDYSWNHPCNLSIPWTINKEIVRFRFEPNPEQPITREETACQSLPRQVLCKMTANYSWFVDSRFRGNPEVWFRLHRRVGGECRWRRKPRGNPGPHRRQGLRRPPGHRKGRVTGFGCTFTTNGET